MALDGNFQPVPHPPGRLFVRNLFDVDPDNPIESLMELAREYGPIYRVDVPGRAAQFIVSGFELVDELCDESRFDKMLGPGLRVLHGTRVGRGLFTSWTSDPEWRKAHNILLPAFSLDAMRGYHPMMLDLAVQLVQKWARLNPEDAIDVPADMTRLTLDTIALCGFNYRFNSFYRDTPHPFVEAMTVSLGTAQTLSRELPIQRKLNRRAARRNREAEAVMVRTVQGLIDERRASGATGTVNDLLDRMLAGVDRQSGQKLDDDNIVAQCITFLVAGHETTSGLLSFAVYALIKNPDVAARAYAEVDRVLGTDPSVLPTYAQIHQLPYLSQVLDETLRLWPTAPAFSRYPYEDTVIGGKYLLEKDSTATVLISMRRWPATTRPARPAIASRCSCRASPSSTCWRSSPPAPCPSTSTSTCCCRSTPATTRSLHPRWPTRRPAASPSAWWRDPPATDAACSRAWPPAT